MEYIEIHEQNVDCLQSIVEVFRHQQIDEEKALAFIQHPATITYVCMDQGKAVGYCLAYRLPRMDNGSDILQIYHLFVLEEYRRQGIARKLVTHMLEYAKQEQLHYVFLLTGTSFTPARKLYESLGGYNHPEFKETYYWYITGQPQP
jgi:ribosomal protein S18 acetylase RimI-like enzyme